MITYTQAVDLIQHQLPKKQKQILPLHDALGYVLAKEVVSQVPLPPMDNSAMDGYVFRSRDTQCASSDIPVRLKIVGVIAAGNGKAITLGNKETYRIMTGAPIPKGADTVLPKEFANFQGNYLEVVAPESKGKHIRYKGEEIRKGQFILKAGERIHSGTIALLASTGIQKVTVYSKPKITMLATGNELVKVGKKIKSGQIYDSNGLMIEAAAKENGFQFLESVTVQDQLKLIDKTFKRLLKESDVVLVSGGVSVGEFDFVKEVFEQNNVRQIFWKVDQKPGKPLYFGVKEKKLIFGLPGNPASAYMCFQVYVLPALMKWSGNSIENRKMKAVLSNSILIKGRKTHFLKARLTERSGVLSVEVIGKQGSHMVSSLHDSNVVAVLPSKLPPYKAGDKIDVIRLDCLR